MALDLKTLKAQLSASRQSWTAGETEVSPYVGQSGEGLFGLRFGDEQRRQLLAEAASLEHLNAFRALPPPPRSIDWRNEQGKNWVTPIRNQKNCGSCVAFATCAMLESRAKLQHNDANYSIDLSEAHLFFCGCGQCCATGWNFVPALDFCKSTGVGLERDFPYTPGNQPCREIPSALYISGYTPASDTIERKRRLAENGPLIGGMRVYEDFYYYKGGVYAHVSGVFKGLHAVAIVGYDDDQECWIAKNSWSTNWGEKGFFRIRYGECGLDSEFPFFDVDLVNLATT